MAIFGKTPYDGMLEHYKQVMGQYAAAAPAPTPEVKRPLPKITVEFCIWLQNEWAEEIRTEVQP